MKEEKQAKMKKSTKYLLIGTLVLFLSILGASVAYYLARVSGNLSGKAAGTELTINVEKLSTNATGDLIPLDNDLETLQLAAAGYDNNGACVDINGYSVCQIYKITVTNKGSVPLTVNGTVTLSGQNVPNIDCATMSDATTVANNNSCMGKNVFVSGDTLPANDSNDYYVMVYINNLDEPQYDSGAFNGTVTFTTEDGKKVKGRFTKPFNLVKHIEELYDLNGGTTENKIAKSEVINNEITYNYATNVGLMNDRLGGTTASLDDGNIRYYGAEPNNFIYFNCEEYPDNNCELWRIIGIFDGKVKIMRNDSIGSYSWDTSASHINRGLGINEWSQADLTKLLNPGFENESVGGSLYYNSQSDTCYNDENKGTISCDFTSTGLKNDYTRNIIKETTYYLGGWSSMEIYPNDIFDYERGNNVFTNFDNDQFNDNITRTTLWNGKVALANISDYGYAADLSQCNTTLSNYNDANCTNNNWMFNSEFQFLLSPGNTNARNVGLIIPTGFVAGGDSDAALGMGIRPTLVLEPSLLMESGSNGTLQNPYKIAD